MKFRSFLTTLSMMALVSAPSSLQAYQESPPVTENSSGPVEGNDAAAATPKTKAKKATSAEAKAGATASFSGSTAEANQQAGNIVVQFEANNGHTTATSNSITISASGFWIGVMAPEPPPASLKAQLSLPLDTGLLVLGVVPESPAEKAGIQIYDVLLEAVVGDAKFPLQNAEQLHQAVQKAEESPLQLLLIRKTVRQSVSVKPVKQPQTITMPLKASAVWKQGLALPAGVSSSTAPAFPVFAGPVTTAVPIAAIVPEGWTVTVTQASGSPMKIHVVHGDQSWDVDEKEINTLPPEIRGAVISMRTRVMPGRMIHLQAIPDNPAKGPVSKLHDHSLPNGAAVTNFVHVELKRIQDEVVDLHNQMRTQQATLDQNGALLQELQAIRKLLEAKSKE